MGLLTLNTSSFDNFTVEEDDDVDEVFPRFLLSPTISNFYTFMVGMPISSYGCATFGGDTTD